MEDPVLLFFFSWLPLIRKVTKYICGLVLLPTHSHTLLDNFLTPITIATHHCHNTHTPNRQHMNGNEMVKVSPHSHTQKHGERKRIYQHLSFSVDCTK